jgi:3-deoxy-D-manno-octulosonic-acid transferase
VPVVKKLKNYKLILSTFTKSGRDFASTLCENVIYLPFDLSFLVRKALNSIKPMLLVISEAELWPNLLKEARRAGAKVMMINGRVPQQSMRNKFAVSFTKEVLKNVDFFGMQTEGDKERLISLGVDSNRVKVIGNSKFDMEGKVREEVRAKLLQDLKLSYPIFVAGSIREGEDEILLDAYKRVLSEFGWVTLIVAPRHLSRVKQLRKKILKHGFSVSLRSSCEGEGGGVVILDTMGELNAAYSLATLTLVGGTFVPIGGHNILEPVTYGKVVLFGPFVGKYEEIADVMRRSGVGVKVKDSAELAEWIIYLLRNPHELMEREKRGAKVVEEVQGATQRIITLIENIIN